MADKNHILITGASGFIGQELIPALLASSPDLHLTIADVVEPPIPSTTSATDKARITAQKADLTDPAVVSSLFSRQFSAVYLLHGIMSGGSEANLDLGLKVNLDSFRLIFDHLRNEYPGTVIVFSSSTAIYGPEKLVSEFATVPQPLGSYGTEKLMTELLLNDFSRRGVLDGRIVRLPTVVVRPGAPTAAASSFASGIVRESLKGIKNVLPVRRDTKMWCCSPATVIKNLVKVKSIPKEKFGKSRVVNLPGISVTVQEILDAVKEVGGDEALSMIEEKYEPATAALVEGWPEDFDTSRAKELGLDSDGKIIEAVKAYAERLKAQ